MDWGFDAEGAEEEERPEAVSPAEDESEGGRRSRRRRRRGRRDGRDEARAPFDQPEAGGDGHVAEAENGAQQEPAWEDLEASDAVSEPPGVGEQPNIPDEPRTLSSEERRGRRGRRRGRRGGRRGRDRDGPRAPGEEHQTEDNLGNGAGLDLAEPTAAEPDAAPFAEPAPLTEPVPLAEPAPLAEPVPLAESTAVAERAPVAEPAPVAEREGEEDVVPPPARSRRAAAAAERRPETPTEAEGAAEKRVDPRTAPLDERDRPSAR